MFRVLCEMWDSPAHPLRRAQPASIIPLSGTLSLPDVYFLSRQRRIIVKSFVFLLLLYGLPCLAQANLQTLSTKAKQFSDYEEDFVGFGHGENNSLEHEISTELFAVAFQNKERAGAATALLTIHLGTLCPQDRSLVETVIRQEFSRYSDQIAIDIKQVNIDVRDTKKPGVAAEALRMQSDLRELQTLLDSMKFSDK
jgi:hypothetical protein